jgi:diguanylate cyclase (GGDEF)-like protein
MASQRDITERKAFEEQLRYQALHDPLTDLPNRTSFMDRLEHALSLANRRQKLSALLLLHLDNFKVVNDSLGHEAGDSLLVAVAERLRVHLRSEDTVARLGGDEFAILLEDITDVSDATYVAERIIEELRGIFVEGREMFVTASIGIALTASSPDQPNDLLRDADTAMYRAKEKGKARYEIFDPSTNVRTLKLLALENDLQRALKREEFRVYYQPKVVLKTGRIIALEALVRWEHPERGLLLPGEFIATAEETGLIVPMGQWMLEEACRQAREWQELYSGDSPLAMSVNVSGRQFRYPGLAQDIAQVLQETQLEPGSLDLEIAESVLVESVQPNVAALHQLKRLGARLAIDDFGASHSSLSYLNSLPADFLKVGRSFVGGLGKDPKDKEVVSAVIDLARVLNIEVVAEGVETAEQVTQLQELGCRFAQGYYLSKPLPAEAAGALLAAEAS